MNLRRLAFKNVWQSRARYLAYLGSAAFSVAVYFLYTALTHHPQLRGGYSGAAYAASATNAAAVVIAVFTFLFLLYSSAAFVRFRMKEFGLLMLLGFTRGQLVRMILWENLIVAASALAVGLSAGLLFLKLFFMGISALLRLPEELSFYAGAPVWIQTVVVFGSFFAAVSLASLRGVLRRSVIELIRARHEPKAIPSSSRLKASLGALLITAGYAWASLPFPPAVIAGVVPVTAMVCLGTYLVLREGSAALLGWLRRRERLFYRPAPFLIISQLIFKVQDNYRVLSAVSLLIAVILTAVGTIYSVFVVVADDVPNLTPQPVQLVVRPGDEAAAGAAAKVREALDRHGVPGLKEVRVKLIEAAAGPEKVYLVPYSVYQALHRPQGRLAALEGERQGIIVYPFVMPDGAVPEEAAASRAHPAGGSSVRLLEVDGETLEIEARFDGTGRLFNGAVGLKRVVVLADALYTRLAEAHPGASPMELVIWTGSAWRGRAMEAALKELAEVPGLEQVLTATLREYYSAISSFGLILFIGIFVSLVFFAATCSLLYFRLFTEIDDDRRYFGRLYELGVDERGVRRLSQAQNAVVFFVPFAVGLVHSTFAMKALSALVSRSVLAEGWLVALAYLLVYALFFKVTSGIYQRAVGAPA